MAVYLLTSDPSGLLAHFKGCVDSNIVRTWSVSQHGNFWFTGSNLGDEAYMSPRVVRDKLVLNVKFFEAEQNKRETYGVIQGRIAEMFVAHCWGMFSDAVISSMPKDGDDLFFG